MHRALVHYAAPKGSEGELIAKYAPLIERLARRMAVRTGIPSLEDDLWSVGALGLIDAARRFEPGRGVKFETFAEHRVRGAMLDELRRLDHLPRRLRERSEEVLKARRNLTQTLGRVATDSEVAERLQMSESELADVENAAQPHAPLDPELFAHDEQPAVDDQVDRKLQAAWLAERVARLPERLQLVLALHYQEGCTYREIATILNISEPRVCQIHAQALEKLRETPDGSGGTR